MNKNINNERFPIGEFVAPEKFDHDLIQHQINIIETLPGQLNEIILKLSDTQLNMPYRDGGWTLRQLVNHIADSHINAYCRFKLTYTESNASIRPYNQDLWADTEDGKNGPVELSLQLIESLHARWVFFLKSLKQEDFNKTFYHPEHKKNFKLYELIASYAWHSTHHLAHISNKVAKEEWN